MGRKIPPETNIAEIGREAIAASLGRQNDGVALKNLAGIGRATAGTVLVDNEPNRFYIRSRMPKEVVLLGPFLSNSRRLAALARLRDEAEERGVDPDEIARAEAALANTFALADMVKSFCRAAER